MGVASPSLGASVANAVDQDSLGTASATQQLMTQIATIAGIQVMQTVQAARPHVPGVSLLASFHTAYLVGAVVAVTGVVCAAFLRSTDRSRLEADHRERRAIGTAGVAALSGVGGMGEVLVPADDGAVEVEMADDGVGQGATP